MFVTLFGAIVNTILDLILIVHFGFGIEGAAVSSLIARVVMMGIGFYGVMLVHDLLSRPKSATLMQDAPAFLQIAAPAVLTNIAPAIGNGYVTYAIAAYGDAAVAAWAILARLTPVAFGAIYALSGAVGPIIGALSGEPGRNPAEVSTSSSSETPGSSSRASSSSSETAPTVTR